jgi:hypothetical protein
MTKEGTFDGVPALRQVEATTPIDAGMGIFVTGMGPGSQTGRP